jgi:hypothetical protein
MRRPLALSTAFAALAALAPRAHGFCRMSACPRGPGTRCAPAQAGDCGEPLAWPGGRASYALAGGGPGEVPAARRAEVVRRAFALWRSVDCGGGYHPRLDVVEAAGERNPIAFSDSWSDLGTLAATRLGFDPDGAIRRARTSFYWSQLRSYGAGSALESIALHEAGHFLGLAHSGDRGALMSRDVHDGKAFHGALTADDAAAVCAAYPVRPPGRAGRGWAAAGLALGGAALLVWLGLWRRRSRPRGARPGRGRAGSPRP